MKKLFLFVCLASVMSAFTSCTKDPETVDPDIKGDKKFTLEAVIADGQATRTQMGEAADGKHYSLWKEGDAIAVYTSTVADAEFSTYTLRETRNEGLNAVFEGDKAAALLKWSTAAADYEGGAVGSRYYGAIYPASTAWIDTLSAGTKNGRLGGEIPTVQEYVEGSFAQDALPMVALWAEGEKPVFKPVGSLVRLKLWAEQPTTLQNVQLTAEPKSGSNAYVAATVAGQVGVHTTRKIYPTYGDPTVPYGLKSVWNGPFYIVQMKGGAKTVTVNGPIALSTDQANPTEVYIAVTPANYATGFTVMLNQSPTMQMKVEAPKQGDGMLKPGVVLDMPVLKYEGVVVDNSLAVQELQATSNFPFVVGVEESVNADDNLPMWTVTWGSITKEVIQVKVKVDKPERGVKFEGTETQAGTEPNSYNYITSTADGQFVGYQSCGRDADNYYYLYMRPEVNGTTDSREQILTLVSDDGAVKVGYVKLVQAGSESQSEAVFQSVVPFADNENMLVAFRDFSNMNSIRVAALSTDRCEGGFTITPGKNNPAQSKLTMPGIEYGRTDYQPIPGCDWAMAYMVDGTTPGTIDVYVKMDANTADNGRNVDLMLQNALGADCATFGLAQAGVTSIERSGIYVGGIAGGKLLPNGEVVGMVNVIPDDPDYEGPGTDYKFYRSYTLTLDDGSALTGIAFSGAAGVFEALPEPTQNSAIFVEMSCDESWIGPFTVGDGLNPTITWVTVAKVDENTGTTREAIINVRLRGSNLLVGQVRVIQPGAVAKLDMPVPSYANNKVTWAAVENADKYTYEIGLAQNFNEDPYFPGSGNWTGHYDVATVTATELDIASLNLQAGDYLLRLRAENNDGTTYNPSYWSSVKFTVEAPTPPVTNPFNITSVTKATLTPLSDTEYNLVINAGESSSTLWITNGSTTEFATVKGYKSSGSFVIFTKYVYDDAGNCFVVPQDYNDAKAAWNFQVSMKDPNAAPFDVQLEQDGVTITIHVSMGS